MPQANKMALLQAAERFPDTTFILKYEDLQDAFAKRAAAK